MKTVKSILFSNDGDSNPGIILLRLFVGAALIYHGAPKLFSGFGNFSSFISSIGIPFPTVMALLAALSEFLGGIFILIGVFTKASALFVTITMVVAVFVVHLNDPFMKKELGLLYLFIGLFYLFKGAGLYSLDYLLSKKGE